MAKTLKVTKGNVQTLVRRGVIPANVAKQVQGGATVSINYEGNLVSSFRPQSMTVDGQTTSFGRGFEPERQRRTTKPRQEREQFISTREGGGAVTMSQADIQEMTRPRVAPQPRGGLAARDGITAREIFTQAREKGITVEEYVGTGPVYREGVPVGGRGVGFAPSPERITTARRDIERDLGLYGRQKDIRPISEQFKEKPVSLKEIAKAVGISFIMPTKKRVATATEKLTRFESERITPSLSKWLGTEKGIRKRDMLSRQYEQITREGVDKEGRFIIPGGKQKFQRDILSIGIGLRKFISKPVTQVAPEIALGIATGGAFRGAGLILEKAPLSVVKAIASPAGRAIRKGARGAAFGTFVGIESISISRAEQPFERIGQTPLRLVAFGVGESISSKVLTPAIRRKTGTPYAELTRQEQLQKTIAPQGKKFFEPFIKLQKKVASAERKGVLNIESEALTPKNLPDVIPKQARPGTIKVIKQQDLLIFGSESVRLKFGKRFEFLRSKIAGEPKPIGDIDTAIKQIKLETAGESLVATVKPTTAKLEVKAQSIGVKGGEKFFDIKPEERLESFEFIGPIKKTVEAKPVRTTSISEELARKIAAGIEYRKEGKDIPDILAISRLLVEQPKTAKLLDISPQLRKTILTRTKAGSGKPENFRKMLGIKKGKTTTATTLQPSKIPRLKKPKAPLIASKLPSKLPLSSQISSFISSTTPISKLPKISSFISSTTPISKLPKSSKLSKSRISSILGTSNIPSPSKIPRPSKVPTSKISSSILSQIPPSKISKSVLPSRIPKGSKIPSIFETPPPTKIIPFKFKYEGFEQQFIKPKKLRRVFKYKPALVAVEKQIKGKTSEILTGLEVRPL